MIRIICSFILSFGTLTGFAWNMQGHQVVAQIAYDNLTPAAKKMCHKYIKSRSKRSHNANFIFAAVWLDLIRYKNVGWYDNFHYINLTFSNDGSALPPVESTNVVRGINNAITILSSKKNNFGDKKLAFYILLHLVGDIHQPLHAGSRVSSDLPKGDLGGNLFPLGNNAVGRNLHQYWDNGAGFFMGSNRIDFIKNKAKFLEQKWPCLGIKNQTSPEEWANSSHELVVSKVYQINHGEVPGKQYQAKAQNIVQERAAMAGCRLAFFLNKMANNDA